MICWLIWLLAVSCGGKVAATTLLKACSRSGDGAQAVAVLDKCRHEGVELDHYGYFKVGL